MLLLPSIYVLGFTLIFSLAVGELVKPPFGATLSPAAFWPALSLSLLFLVLGALHLSKLRLGERQDYAPIDQSPTLPEAVPDHAP